MVSIRDLRVESSARRGSGSNVDEVGATGSGKDESKVQYYTESLRANREPLWEERDQGFKYNKSFCMASRKRKLSVCEQGSGVRL